MDDTFDFVNKVYIRGHLFLKIQKHRIAHAEITTLRHKKHKKKDRHAEYNAIYCRALQHTYSFNMQIAKTLIITGLIGLAGMLTQVEAASTNYEHCTVTCNGAAYKAARCRVIGNTARIASAEDGFTHLLIGEIKVVADNSLPPCPY